jgi:hypothetical protein
MIVALIVAGALAGLSATLLGLVDAGREIEESLSRMEQEASALHRATTDTIERGATADAVTRPKASLRKMIDAFEPNAARVVRSTATPYTGTIAVKISEKIDLVPPVEGIEKAFGEYLDKTKQAQADARGSQSAKALSTRLLELSSGVVVQKIADARDQTRLAVASALNALQLITFLSIGIAALVVGLTPDQYS